MNYLLVNFGQVTDGQTDGHKVVHMSPSGICTGALKYTINIIRICMQDINSILKSVDDTH